MNAYQLVALTSALALEVKNPRMKAHSRLSTLSKAKEYGYNGKARKLDALVWCVEVMLNNGLTPNPNVVGVLESKGYALPV
jgi:hypothetical protein